MCLMTHGMYYDNKEGVTLITLGVQYLTFVTNRLGNVTIVSITVGCVGRE